MPSRNGVALRPLTFAALTTLAACHHAAAVAVEAGPTVGDAGRGAATDAAVTIAPPRCTIVVRGTSLGGDANDVQVGEAVSTEQGIAVGLLRSKNARASATIALVSDDLARVAQIDLGASLGDAPPPQPFLVGKQLFAVSYAGAGQDGGPTKTRALAFFRIDDDKASRVAVVEEKTDESFAFDVAGGPKAALVAWDEDAPAGDHGLIKVAGFDAQHAVGPHVVSPDGTDADQPRLLSRPGGYWLAWIARRQEARPEAGAPSELEGPAEGRDQRWIELARLDEAGKVVGTVRRLTSLSGHVSGFTLVPGMPSTGAGPDGGLDVLARDDGEQIEGGGGKILRISAHGETVDTPATLVADGVGRGAPGLLAWSGPSGMPSLAYGLAYADTSDRTRIVPLSSAGTPLGPPSVEPLLDDARFLGTARNKAWIVASSPTENADAGAPAPLRALTCTP